MPEPRPFDLIETLRFDPDDGFIDLEAHVARIGASAELFGFGFDRHGLRNELHAATFRLAVPSAVRLRLSPTGTAAIECRPLPAPPATPVLVEIVALPLAPDDPRLTHNRSDRPRLADVRRHADMFDILFARPDGALTGGSLTNLFVRLRDGRLVTPTLADGAMPGILRGRLIEEGRAIEGRLVAADLAGGCFVGNVVFGLLAAMLVEDGTGRG